MLCGFSRFIFMQQIIQNLTANLKDFFQKSGAKKAVVGVSGGVDSACVLALAVRALGKENVLALLMPHKDFSSLENLNDARNLVKSLGVEYQEIEISHLTERFFALDFTKKDLTKANIMARVRMILLYALANEKNGLVLGTGNKTEILTGYFTKYGDGGVDTEVLGDLWKTEVFVLAGELGLPEVFVSKKPSAELYQNHYDEEEIGASYAEIDQILQKIESGEFVPQNEKEKKVHYLYLSSAHKRNMPPIITCK